jgi:hypothetical protein
LLIRIQSIGPSFFSRLDENVTSLKEAKLKKILEQAIKKASFRANKVLYLEEVNNKVRGACVLFDSRHRFVAVPDPVQGPRPVATVTSSLDHFKFAAETTAAAIPQPRTDPPNRTEPTSSHARHGRSHAAAKTSVVVSVCPYRHIRWSTSHVKRISAERGHRPHTEVRFAHQARETDGHHPSRMSVSCVQPNPPPAAPPLTSEASEAERPNRGRFPTLWPDLWVDRPLSCTIRSHAFLFFLSNPLPARWFLYSARPPAVSERACIALFTPCRRHTCRAPLELVL